MKQRCLILREWYVFQQQKKKRMKKVDNNKIIVSQTWQSLKNTSQNTFLMEFQFVRVEYKSNKKKKNLQQQMRIKEAICLIMLISVVVSFCGPNHDRCLGYCKKRFHDENGGYYCVLENRGSPQCYSIGGDEWITGNEVCNSSENYQIHPQFGNLDVCVNGQLQPNFECRPTGSPPICRYRVDTQDPDVYNRPFPFKAKGHGSFSGSPTNYTVIGQPGVTWKLFSYWAMNATFELPPGTPSLNFASVRSMRNFFRLSIVQKDPTTGQPAYTYNQAPQFVNYCSSYVNASLLSADPTLAYTNVRKFVCYGKLELTEEDQRNNYPNLVNTQLIVTGVQNYYIISMVLPMFEFVLKGIPTFYNENPYTTIEYHTTF